MFRHRSSEKVVVAGSASFALLYSVVVLVYVATVPDLRFRVLMSDDDRPAPFGVVIRDMPGIELRGTRPEVGDTLVRIGDQPIRSFGDYARSLRRMRRATVPPGGLLNSGDDPSLVREPLPSLVEMDNGVRLVEVEFLHDGGSRTAWIVVQSLPPGELLLTLVWFLLQLGITAVSVLAVWHRPFDHPARGFFAMCIVTMGAFVGGFHWWVLASALPLNIPFVGCALFVPAVSLHFFLTYPRRTWPLKRIPRLSLVLLYAVPTITFLLMVGMLAYVEWQTHIGSDAATESVLKTMRVHRDWIYGYLTFAAACFVIMLTALAHGYLRTSNSIERSQMRLIFWGGVSAVLPIGYTLYLAFFNRVEFALGRAKLSMFLASLSFMLAYAVAILRYKLMLIDQIVSKGMRYYAARIGLTILFAGLVSVGGLVVSLWSAGVSTGPSFQQLVMLGAVLAIAVTVVLWGRDRLQQLIDRSFYREKYQLDKALQRMNRAVERVVDRETLAERMIGSCREVLRPERIAVYLRDPGRPSFQLVAVEGTSDLPAHFVVDEELMRILESESAVARSPSPLLMGPSTAQQMLRALRAEVLYAFDSQGEISGAVALGPKQNGTPYTAEDLTFLNALAQITNVAMHSVKVQQDIVRLNEELQLKVERIDEQRRVIAMLQEEIRMNQAGANTPNIRSEAEFERGQIKGSSPAIQKVLDTVRKVAQSESSVLITGPSGTGKELLAHAIHVNSSRRNNPMISVHCAALSSSLLESELFGHVKGAFTGAHKDRVGRFELAHGGTLFLDEIGDISLETQIKLLRVLQTRQFEPVGGTRTVQVDVRLITATHQDLKKLIAEGKFREDLYYRLNVISITLPTLAERKEDIYELSLHFLKHSAQRVGKPVSQISDEAVEALKRYSWPGNIRELQNVLERAVVLAEGECISIRDLPREVVEYRLQRVERRPGNELGACLATLPPGADILESGVTTQRKMWRGELAEQEAIKDALHAANGNKAEAARLLGIPRSTLFSKLRKYRINKPR
jgi:transcriptional regulator with GAF, ATPase, and Fis domain